MSEVEERSVAENVYTQPSKNVEINFREKKEYVIHPETVLIGLGVLTIISIIASR